MASKTAAQFIARVRALREALGLSQEAFAERAGLKYKHYQSVEAGRRLNLKLETLEKIAKACDRGLNELFDFEKPLSVVAEDSANPAYGRGATKNPGKAAVSSPPAPKRGVVYKRRSASKQT